MSSPRQLSRSLYCLSSVFVTVGLSLGGCVGGESPDGGANDAGDATDAGQSADAGPANDDAGLLDGGAPLDAGAQDAGLNDAGLNDAGLNDAGLNDAGPQGTCPAPEAANDTLVVFGETVATGWDASGFAGPLSTEATEQVCSGTRSARYTSNQYDGFQFSTDGTAFVAGRLSVRVYLDAPSQWAVAAVQPGEEDPHQIIGEDTWEAGWQQLEYDIPASTTSTRWILFEKQSPGPATIWIDDLRLIAR